MKTILFFDEKGGALSRDLTAPIAQAGYQVTTLLEGGSLIEYLNQSSPDMVVLFLGGSGVESLDILRQIHEQSQVPVLLVSGMSTSTDRVLGLEFGAEDYLETPISSQELLARIRAILRRIQWTTSRDPSLDAGGVEHSCFRLDLERRTLYSDSKSVDLTWTEFSIIKRMLLRPEKIYSRNDLLQIISAKSGVSARTIDTHMANLRRKLLQLRPDQASLHSIRGVGYRFGY